MKLPITAELEGKRLDHLLVARLEGASRASVKRLFADGSVRVIDTRGRSRRAVKGERAVPGTVVEIEAASDPGARLEAAPDSMLPLEVVLERDDVVIVDKPAGVPSAPLRPGELGTVAGALVARYPEMREVGWSPREPGLCHRLDTHTSGLLLAARTAEAFEAMVAALRARQLDKRYLLVCEPAPMDDDGIVELPLATDPKNRRRVRACGHPQLAAQVAARPAETRYRVLRRTSDRALVEARVARGHRHQIRAHFASIGSPLLGDHLYGGVAVSGLERHALHASRILWRGSIEVAAFDVSSTLPAELTALVET
jgi:23S rRNA pseudouridine1911/1915/1917 synthase